MSASGSGMRHTPHTAPNCDQAIAATTACLPPWLQEHARVDLESARNTGPFAYLPVEVLLAKLEALTGTAAAAQAMKEYQQLYQ